VFALLCARLRRPLLVFPIDVITIVVVVAIAALADRRCLRQQQSQRRVLVVACRAIAV
jgi:hypothetical protein